MNITVILCTFNRCKSLATALDSVAVSTLPESVHWEVLVVDNNSKDRTREVVDEFRRRYPGRFRYQFEPQPGKSHALNTGIHEAGGDVLAFMDDDVTVEATWLQNLTAVFADDEWLGSAGRILPERGFTPPKWLSLKGSYGGAPLALWERGPEGKRLDEPPFGTNMAFRKKAFAMYGGFRTDLGPRPSSEMKNEDNEFGRRLLASGERLYYEPAAVVYHSVPENRVQKVHFLTWWFDKARSEIRAFGIPADTKWFIDGIPLYLFSRLTRWTLQWMVTINPQQRFECKIKVWLNAGLIVECYRLSPRAKRRNQKTDAKAARQQV